MKILKIIIKYFSPHTVVIIIIIFVNLSIMSGFSIQCGYAANENQYEFLIEFIP